MSQTEDVHEEHIHLPDPTPWPLVLALGITFIPAGVLLGPGIPIVGLIKLPILTLLGVVLFVTALLNLVREDIELFRAGDNP